MEATIFNDINLRESVLEELAWEPCVTAAHIAVTALEGVVTLVGHVGSYAEKQAAEAATRRVKGVKAVAEEIEVRLSPDGRREDRDMAEAALTKLAWNGAVPVGAVKVRVSDGWVTLSGVVEWRFQLDAAEGEARSLRGVTGITNEIRIKPLLNTALVSADVARALTRAWFDPRGIKVTAEAGRIRVSGSVHSWTDRVLAANVAWAAPGATAVENDLIIT